jgi:hypothetical protein
MAVADVALSPLRDLLLFFSAISRFERTKIQRRRCATTNQRATAGFAAAD